MNIMVYDVQADSGGAAAILEQYYEMHKKDKSNHYYYMLSVYNLPNTDNITVINEPYVKRSWWHRLYFDYVGVNKYLKKYKIDEVLSLQNTIIPCFKGHQTVYEHNALPFSEYRFSFTESRRMWIYQNIISKFILRSIKKANSIIVQTDWMRSEIEKSIPSSKGKIEVCFPNIIVDRKYIYHEKKPTVFFYPASPELFKNHRLILDAAQILKDSGKTSFSIVFTLCGDETDYIRDIRDIAINNSINIQWIGKIPHEKVYEYYTHSILVFPSYIETVGLPIYEAKTIGSPLLIADCKYSRNIGERHNNIHYFKYDDAIELARLMNLYIN